MNPTPSEARGRILLVEDDIGIANGLALNLRLEGFETRVVTQGDHAAGAIESFAPDLVLLDITLPKRSGLEVLGDLRAAETAHRNGTTPVIVVSARQNEFDKVTALRLGADDYVTKPFGVAELLARIEAVLRRSRAVAATSESSKAEGSNATLRFGDIEINTETRDVLRHGQLAQLTKLEFDLLHFLASHPRRVFSRDDLLQQVWGVEYAGSPRTVDNFVGQLRAKLEDDPSKPRHFVTVRGNGYKFLAE